MIEVKLNLYDVQERQWFNQFMSALDVYRAEAKQPAKPAEAPPHPAAPGNPVIAEIKPDAAPVKAEDVRTALMVYLNKHGMEPALAMLQSVGVNRFDEVVEPGKLAELYAKLMEAAK
jgi:hypothetical protein